MDKYERRRLNLIELRDKKCNGKAAELAKKIGRDPSYVSRMLYEEKKPGKKRIADDMIEVIEAAFSLPRGWLDSDGYQGDQITVGDDGTPMIADSAPMIAGMKIKTIEHILLDNYRGMSQSHKEALEQMANALYLIDNPKDGVAGARANKKNKEKI